MKNRTNTIVFHRNLDKELDGLLKGKCEPGHVSYTFGTVQAAARWLSTPAGKREVRKSMEVVWRTGNGDCDNGEFVRHGSYCTEYEFGREALSADVEDVLSSSAEKEMDDAYLDHWKEVARRPSDAAISRA